MSFALRYLFVAIAALAAGILCKRLLDPPDEERRKHDADMRAERLKSSVERREQIESQTRDISAKLTTGIVSLIPMSRASRVRTREKLVSAGLMGTTPEMWWALNVLAALVGIAVAIATISDFMSLRTVATILCAAVLGPVLCNYVLGIMTKNRRREVAIALPNALDLLASVCYAGSTLDAGMQQVANHMEGPIAQEFGIVASDVAAGIPRDVALKAFARRVDTDTVNSFVTAVIEAQKTGLGISAVLIENAKHIRTKRSLEIEEEAGKLPVKMLPVIVLFIFSTIDIAILAPFVGGLMEAFSASV